MGWAKLLPPEWLYGQWGALPLSPLVPSYCRLLSRDADWTKV
jgi:hypothetical protein